MHKYGFGHKPQTIRYVKMIRNFSKCFFPITLFLLTCPSIFINSQTVDQKDVLVEELIQKHEIFQHFMTEAREQAQTIGFCVQQLCQTIGAGKIKLEQQEKTRILEELSFLSGFITIITDKLLIQNSHDALFEGILINNVMINYLTHVISTDIRQLNIQTMHTLLTKKYASNISDEAIFNIAQSNQEKIKKLVDSADHIGLTWYNYAYRGLKEHNAYSIAKGVGIAGVTSIALCIALCMLNQPTHIKWLDEKIIGFFPKTIPGIAEPQVLRKNAENKLRYKSLNPEDQTYIQSLIISMENCKSVGLLATGALITLNYKDLFSWMYQEPTHWAHEKLTKQLKTIDQKLQGTAKQNISNSGYEKVYFKDMVGCEELELLAKKIANFMKHPERYERALLEEHRGILLFGPPQTGKTLFAKALRTLIEDELDDSKQLHFIDAKKYIDAGYDVEYVFWYASFYAPCIIFFDEIDLIGTHREKNPISTSQLLTCMQGIDMASKQIIVIGATNRPEQIDKALLVDGRFGKIIHIEYPKYQDRKTYLEQQLAKRCIELDPAYIDCIAQETEGCSYNTLKRIITEAIILSSLETRPVMQADFEKTVDVEVRHIQPSKVMSTEERKIIATYQAGKAIARHLLKTIQEVVKITINPVIKDVKSSDAGLIIDSANQKASDNEKLLSFKKEQRVKLGDVFTKSPANHVELLSDLEQEKECLALLAGSAALQIVFNQTFAECNKHDRAEVMHIIYGRISQGEKITEKTKEQALAIKKIYEDKILALLQEHQDLLAKVIDLLMQQPTIDRYEWKTLIS